MTANEQEATGTPDLAADAARTRLAEWLTAQAATADVAASVEDLQEWAVRPIEEYLVFVPPGLANQVFLVADHGISSYAPSERTLDDAILAARPHA